MGISYVQETLGRCPGMKFPDCPVAVLKNCRTTLGPTTIIRRMDMCELKERGFNSVINNPLDISVCVRVVMSSFEAKAIRLEIDDLLTSGRIERMETVSAHIFQMVDRQWKELTNTEVLVHIVRDSIDDVYKILARDQFKVKDHFEVLSLESDHFEVLTMERSYPKVLTI
ncbi:unnamed protein product [Angiostrongylus costaricensis]|uniref:Protein-tyrosine sulfotransferase n=1 Tax=Angiostrongylus costaricensis TaxID=334426 RepID=A0A0R3PP14_ANGCS|nr:unnamed protein product [Angiostrongylus costaricensis]